MPQLNSRNSAQALGIFSLNCAGKNISTANYKGNRMSKMMSNKYPLFAIFERRTF